MKHCNWLGALLAGLALGIIPAHAELTVYPGPDESLACDIYKVTVSQNEVTQEAFVTQNVSDWETQAYFKHIKIYETLSYAGFSFTDPIEVEVTKISPKREGVPDRTWLRQPSSAKTVIVRPKRFGIETKVTGNTARFTLTRPGQYSVEFVDSDLDQNGCPRHGLMLFADPPEDPVTIPDPEDKQVLVVKPGRTIPRDAHKRTVVRFESGMHELGPWTVPQGVEQIYLAPGAFVSGALRIENRENGFLLNGRGTLSGRSMGWHFREPPAKGEEPNAKRSYVELLRLGGVGIKVDGITLADSPNHTFVGSGSHHHVSWIKVIGWKYNNDGIRGYEDSIIEHCFIRANDDAIWLDDDNLVVRDTIFWQGDNGSCFQLGWSSVGARNIQVRDIDVIHTEWGRDRRHNNAGFLNLRIPSNRSGDPQVQEDFLFENINIETPAIYTIDLRMRKDGGGKRTLRNFTFRNLNMNMAGESPYAWAVFLPWDETFGFENFRFENTRVNGVLVTEENYANEGRFSISPVAKPEIHFLAETRPYSWTNPLENVPKDLHQTSIVRVGSTWYLDNIVLDDDHESPVVEIWASEDSLTWVVSTRVEIVDPTPIRSAALSFHPGTRIFYLALERRADDAEQSWVEIYATPSFDQPWRSLTAGEPIAHGSDPSLFIDHNDRAYLLLAGNSISEIDLVTGEIVAGPVSMTKPESERPGEVAVGNPQLRRKYNTYHLFWTEANDGEGTLHTASSSAVWGPYRRSFNPLYGEPRTLPFLSADIYDGPDGAWWIVTNQSRDADSHHSIDRIRFDEASQSISARQTRKEQTVAIPAKIRPEVDP